MKLSSRRLIIIIVTVIAVGVVFMIARVFRPSAPAPTAQSPASSMSAATSQSSQSAQSAQSTSGQSSAQSASPAPAEAVTVLEAVAAETAAALEAPQSDGNPSAASYTGAALDELLAQYDEWARIGLRQEGSPTIENPMIVSGSPDDDRMVIRACVDSSNVHVYNEADLDLRADEVKRALTLFTLVKVDGTWKLESEDFAYDPTC